MRFLALFFCTFLAAADARAASLEERLVTLFKEFCLAPKSWDELRSHTETFAATRSWKVRAVPEPNSHITMMDPKYFVQKAWEFDEGDATLALAGYSIIGPNLPNVRQNSCMVGIRLENLDKVQYEALRKAVPAEVERQLGSAIAPPDPLIPLMPRNVNWRLIVPSTGEPDCARSVVFPVSGNRPENPIVLALMEIAYPNDTKWEPMHRGTRCYLEDSAKRNSPGQQQ